MRFCLRHGKRFGHSPGKFGGVHGSTRGIAVGATWRDGIDVVGAGSGVVRPKKCVDGRMVKRKYCSVVGAHQWRWICLHRCSAVKADDVPSEFSLSQSSTLVSFMPVIYRAHDFNLFFHNGGGGGRWRKRGWRGYASAKIAFISILVDGCIAITGD